MDAVTAALAAQHAELDGLLSGLDERGWGAPTRCPGWSVCDVVLHLAQTDELAVASLEGRFAAATAGLGLGTRDVDEAVGAYVAAERGAPPAEVLARWRAAAAAARAGFAACDPRARLPWVVDDLSARTFATTRLAECWIHTTDVADALGEPVGTSDRLRHVARLAWRTIPYAFARAGAAPPGPVDVVLTGPGGVEWAYGDGSAPSVVRGDALEFCLVAARRLDPGRTSLVASGPDGTAALRLVRTWA